MMNSRWRLDVRRLVELDMGFLGRKVIVAEFAAGVAGSIVLGALSLAYAARLHAGLISWPVLGGIELVAIGVNYVPLLIAALQTKQPAKPDDAAEARRYGVRQAWLLVPLATVVFALWPASSRRSQSAVTSTRA